MNRLTRFTHLLGSVVSALVLAVTGSDIGLANENTVVARQPNILFIYTDNQSYRTVSCYPGAYKFCKTPNIDALAKRGVRFTHAYIGTWCLPSRATLLTGHHPYGVKSLKMEGEYPGSTYDPKQCPFWPSVFRKNGYTTAQIGKWHTGTDTGFGRDWDYQVVWNRPRPSSRPGNYYKEQGIEENGKPVRLVQGYSTDNYTNLTPYPTNPSASSSPPMTNAWRFM